MDMVPRAPFFGVAGEGSVGDDDRTCGAVHWASSPFHLVHHMRANIAADFGVLGLEDDPAALAVLADDVGGLISLLANSPSRPSVPVEEIRQRKLELLVVHGVDLGPIWVSVIRRRARLAVRTRAACFERSARQPVYRSPTAAPP